MRAIGRIQEAGQRAAAREPIAAHLRDDYAAWVKFKAKLQKEIGLQIAMDLSFLPQWGLSGGGSPSLQVFATPSIDWALFKSSTWGAGSVQLAYNAVPTYPTRQDAAMIQSNLGLVTAINDLSSKTFQFPQLTYTHATPGNAVSIGIGQYPFYNFDGNQYLANQQINFNSMIFAQNGASTYPLAGIGAFAQWNVTSTMQFAAGFQGANNLSGQTLTTRTFGDDGYAWFAYAQWTPKFTGRGTAQYSMSWFSTPSLPAQASSRVWSINAVQNLDDDWAVFARANRAIGYATTIRGSWVLGAARNNPLGRNAADQIGFAIGMSEVAAPPSNPVDTRNETVSELYWNWSLISGGLVLSPSAQWIWHPGLDPMRESVWVLGLRATLLF
ncbi:MAG: carbohydrate porin [Betaproteobacteria bacterium]